MHPMMTISHWSHHWHENMQMLRHHISDHFYSRHFWVGVGVTLLVIGILTLLFIAARYAPYTYPQNIPYAPYL